MLHRSEGGYTPTIRSRYSDNVSITFGRPRARFPASGRRRNTYDSMLHAFVKKISPSRFRRASSLRFVHVASDITDDFRENILHTQIDAGFDRRRRLVRKAAAASYLSAP